MSTYKYDIFISYAVEDKLELAYPFCQHLENKGLKVWYSGRELRYGESIEKVVKEGLEKSRYGIILITPHYFQKKWTIKELYSLWSMEHQGKNIILPVFHQVTHQDVAKHDPVLADRWAFTTDKGLAFIADEVEKVVKAENVNKQSKKNNRLIFKSVLFLLLLAIGIFSFKNYLEPQALEEEFVDNVITKRISKYQSQIEEDSPSYLDQDIAKPINKQKAVAVHADFDQIVSKYRNNYEFNTGQEIYKFKVNVEPYAGISFDTLSAVNNYGFLHPIINKISNADELGKKDIQLYYFNTQPFTYAILNTNYTDTLVAVSVAYQNYLREFLIDFKYGPETSYFKTKTCKIKGLRPKEEYLFAFVKNKWQFLEVR